MRDGVLRRAPDEMLKYAAEFTVSKDQLEAKLAEMINTVGKIAQKHAQNPAVNKLDNTQFIIAARPNTPLSRSSSTSSSYIV